MKSISNLSDEIIIINKSSSDKSLDVIDSLCLKHVSVVTVPYRVKGDDDYGYYSSLAKHDWIFIMVASEVAPVDFARNISNSLKSVNFAKCSVIMIPRIYYCFGFNVHDSPWDISYFPFMFNRKKSIITNVPHEHVRPKSEVERVYLYMRREHMIRHFAHVNKSEFMKSVIGYGELEVLNESEADSLLRIRSSIRNIRVAYYKLKSKNGLFSLMHFAAWNLHWSYQILVSCDRLLTSRRDKLEDSLQSTAKLNKTNFIKLGVKDSVYIFYKVRLEPLLFEYKSIEKIRYLFELISRKKLK